MKNPNAVQLGSIRSEKKARASRANGKLGGRPRGAPPVRPFPPPPHGFIVHPKWDMVAANASGEIMRLYLKAAIPYWRLAAQSVGSSGYCQIGLPGHGASVLCHRIVYECINGEVYNWSCHSAEGLTIDHINGCKTDNRIENLQILTQSQNVRKRNSKHGLPLYVSKHGTGYRIHIKPAGMGTVNSKTYRTLEDAMQNRSGFLAQHGKVMPKELPCV